MDEDEFEVYRREQLTRVRPIRVSVNPEDTMRPVLVTIQNSEHVSTEFDLNEAEARALRDALNAQIER